MPELWTNGVRLHYAVEGEGAEVLLLHPVGLDLTAWDALAGVLSNDFRVLRVDLRGHGQSAALPPSNLADFVTDVHLLLGTLRCTPVDVIGLSLGGMVAQLLAIEYPDDVRSLVLAATASTFSPAMREMLIDRGMTAEREGMQAVVQPTLERWFTPGFLHSEVVARCRQRLLTDDVACWTATWRAMAALETLPRLNEIHVPTFVVTGDADASTPPSAAQTIVDSIGGARLSILAGAPHLAPYERPDLFTPLVLSFLGSETKGQVLGQALLDGIQPEEDQASHTPGVALPPMGH